MSTSVCPICGKKHKNKDTVCIWDNLKLEGVPDVEYFYQRLKRHQTLLEEISQIEQLRSKVDRKRKERSSLSLKLNNLNTKTADVERQIQLNSKSINLAQQEKQLGMLITQLDGLKQDLAQLKKELRAISDYDDLKSCLSICQILLNIH